MRDLGVGATAAHNPFMTWFLGACIVSLAAAAPIRTDSAWAGLAAKPGQSVAPPFSLQDVDGQTRTLNEFLGAKPVVLAFMSIDCPHCREMAPVLTQLHEAYGSRFVFLTVVFERRAPRAKAFAQVHGHTWCYLLGTEATARAYALEGVPTFLLLGPDGRIRGVQLGSCPYEEFVRAIEGALGSP
jgi:thiol-disulfide isomerase/thioredoxin